MQIDEDIGKMSKAQLKTTLQALKEAGKKLDGKRLTYSGNVAHLREQLQKYRNTNPGEATEEAESSTRKRSASKTDVGEGQIQDILDKHDRLHPATVYCLTVVEGQEGEYMDEVKDKAEIERLYPLLKPAMVLCNKIAAVQNDMADNLDSSPAVNYPALVRLVRHNMLTVQAEPELQSLFDAFDIAVVAHEVEQSPLFEPQTGEERIADRFGLDSDPLDAPDNMDVDAGARVSKDTKEPDEELARQVALIQQGVLMNLVNWQLEFPKAAILQYPDDFNAVDVKTIDAFVRKYVNDDDHEANDLDISVATLPVDVVTKLAEAIIEDDSYPNVERAKTIAVISASIRRVCATKRGHLTAKARKAKKIADADSARQAAEQDEGVAAAATSVSKKRKSKEATQQIAAAGGEEQPLKYRTAGLECVKCFFRGSLCSLQGSNSEYCCSTCYDPLLGGQCRILCADCVIVADQAGRASGEEHEALLEAGCTQCEIRYDAEED